MQRLLRMRTLLTFTRFDTGYSLVCCEKGGTVGYFNPETLACSLENGYIRVSVICNVGLPLFDGLS